MTCRDWDEPSPAEMTSFILYAHTGKNTPRRKQILTHAGTMISLQTHGHRFRSLKRLCDTLTVVYILRCSTWTTTTRGTFGLFVTSQHISFWSMCASHPIFWIQLGWELNHFDRIRNHLGLTWLQITVTRTKPSQLNPILDNLNPYMIDHLDRLLDHLVCTLVCLGLA